MTKPGNLPGFFFAFLVKKSYYTAMSKVTITNLSNKDQTGREMHRLIRRYSTDLHYVKVWQNGKLVPLSSLPINKIFEIVRNIPYRRDNKPIEVVARPYKILNNRNVGMDCKKKAILLASYLRSRGLPYRLIASSRLKSKRVHHVFPQMAFGDQWLNFDATYPHYRPFESKQVTKAEVL